MADEPAAPTTPLISPSPKTPNPIYKLYHNKNNQTMSTTTKRAQLRTLQPGTNVVFVEDVLTTLVNLASILVDTEKKISITWELWVREDETIKIEVYVHADGRVTHFDDAVKQHRDIETLLYKITRQ